MAEFWGIRSEQRPAVSADFERALTQEVLRTELIRIKAILVTLSVLLAILTAAYAISPSDIERIWHGHFPILSLYAAFVLFVVFELSVMRLLSQRLAQARDVPYARRYLGALIETSLPTVGLYLQMTEMGPTQALAFVAPLIYFIFIILSTLRLDFWLSTFTGLVASAELLGMAIVLLSGAIRRRSGA
jgi:adenylate cyclase